MKALKQKKLLLKHNAGAYYPILAKVTSCVHLLIGLFTT